MSCCCEGRCKRRLRASAAGRASDAEREAMQSLLVTFPIPSRSERPFAKKKRLVGRS